MSNLQLDARQREMHKAQKPRRGRQAKASTVLPSEKTRELTALILLDSGRSAALVAADSRIQLPIARIKFLDEVLRSVKSHAGNALHAN